LPSLSGILFIPVSSNLLLPLSCRDGTFLDESWTCWSGVHVTLLLVGLVFFAAFVVLTGFGTSPYFTAVAALKRRHSVTLFVSRRSNGDLL
jgi:hypothetical protein